MDERKSYQKSKWGHQVFSLLLRNGVTPYSELKNLKDSNGNQISGKVLWETLKNMQNEDIVEDVPSKGRHPNYDLTPKFRTKEFDQIIYFNEMPKEIVFSDTMEFQHTVYGVPSFDDMTEKQQKIAMRSIWQIEDSLCDLKKLGKEDVALLSTTPVNRTKVVRENIELRLNVAYDDSLIPWEECGKGHTYKMAEVIYAGKACRGGRWIKEWVSEQKFFYHKLLNKCFLPEEIVFMLSLIKEIVNEYKDIHYAELEKFIVYKGFSKGGLWYDENKKYFNRLADDITKSKDGEEFYHLHITERWKKIKQDILNHRDTPPSLRKDTSELVLYIEARLYFEKVRPIRKRELAKGFGRYVSGPPGLPRF